MAWLDDRVWCHPKLADVSDRSFRVWISGMAYSSGFGTKGILSAGHQRTIGSDARSRRELVAAGLWHEIDQGIEINDWDEHNGKRDARRVADRERKRAARSAGKSSGTSAGQSAGTARVEGSDGSEGSEGEDLKAVGGSPPIAFLKARTADEISREVQLLMRNIKDVDEGTEGVLLSYARKLPLASVAKVRESCASRKVRAGYAVRALQSELAEREEVA